MATTVHSPPRSRLLGYLESATPLTDPLRDARIGRRVPMTVRLLDTWRGWTAGLAPVGPPSPLGRRHEEATTPKSRSRRPARQPLGWEAQPRRRRLRWG